MGRGWDDEDTMHLLEALMHYGDDRRKVAQYVGKSEKEFVTHFIKIPFGEEFIADLESKDAPSPCKRMCLTPLADAGNPIMAQVILEISPLAFFLSKVVNFLNEILGEAFFH